MMDPSLLKAGFIILASAGFILVNLGSRSLKRMTKPENKIKKAN